MTKKQDNFEPEVEIAIVSEFSENKEKETCDICEFSCETEKDLACHRETTHRLVPIGSQNTEVTHADKTVFYCDKCEYTTDDEHSLQYHTQAVHIYQCDKCNYTAKNKGWITRHIKSCHQIDTATGSTELQENEQGTPPSHPCSWFWLGHEGQEQGPFPWFHMSRWLNEGLLSADSMIKREGDEDFASLEEFQKTFGSQPFGYLST